MLESIPTSTEQAELIRLAVHPKSSDFFQEQGLDERSIGETLQLLGSRNTPIQLKDIVDRTFKPKPRLAKTRYATRFSDGSFPVLYGSTDTATAATEVKHWFSKQVSGKPAHARTAFYVRFAYRFDGDVKDLRAKQTEWLDLRHDYDYQFCNRLGAEAVAAGLDGLLAPSVRNVGGTNLPVFARQAVSNFREGEFVAITQDPKTGETSLHEAGS